MVMCAVATALAWSPVLWMWAPHIRFDLLRDAGWSLPAIRALLIVYGTVPYLILYLIGCWLAWRVLRSVDSRYARLPLLLMAVIVLVAAGDVGKSLVHVGVLHQIAYALWYSSLYSPEILLTAVVLLAATEPYSSMRLEKQARSRVRVYASFAMLVWFIPTPSAWWVVEDVRDFVSWPVFHMQLSVARFLGEFGWSFDVAIVLVWMTVVYGFWYFVIRTVVAWRMARSRRDDQEDPVEAVGSVT